MFLLDLYVLGSIADKPVSLRSSGLRLPSLSRMHLSGLNTLNQSKARESRNTPFDTANIDDDDDGCDDGDDTYRGQGGPLTARDQFISTLSRLRPNFS